MCFVMMMVIVVFVRVLWVFILRVCDNVETGDMCDYFTGVFYGRGER